MPKSDAERQKTLYDKQKKSGLVPYKRMVREEWKPILDKTLDKLRNK